MVARGGIPIGWPGSFGVLGIFWTRQAACQGAPRGGSGGSPTDAEEGFTNFRWRGNFFIKFKKIEQILEFPQFSDMIFQKTFDRFQIFSISNKFAHKILEGFDKSLVKKTEKWPETLLYKGSQGGFEFFDFYLLFLFRFGVDIFRVGRTREAWGGKFSPCQGRAPSTRRKSITGVCMVTE